MKTIAFIFARGGSKGLRRKNLLELGGISLVGRAVKQALAVAGIERVIISTDDQEIADEAVIHGAECHFLRPDSLATDTASEWDAWRHAVEWLEQNLGSFDLFVSVPATSPLRRPEDIENAIKLYEGGEVEMVITGSAAERNPYFNMVKQCDNGEVALVCAEKSITRRQDAPKIYDMTTVAYVTSPQYVAQYTNLWGGRTKISLVPKRRAADVDTLEDLTAARAVHGLEPEYYDAGWSH